MTYDYQKTNRYFAQVADDIKDLAEQELHSLGAEETSPAYRGIYFNASPEVLYNVNFSARLLSRVLAPLVSFKCHTDKVLYKRASEVDWRDFLTPDQTFAVFASVSHSAMRHSKFAALRLKDAIVDTFRTLTGQRPSIDTREPDVWFNLHIENNQAIISLDTSGGSLHRRGYRQKSVEAPMIETLAAAIIKYSGWDGSHPLYDPFCGSGTLLCEGYLAVTKTPAAILRRKFGFQSLPDFDASIWENIRAERTQNIKSLSGNIIAGSDISMAAVNATRQNCSVIDKKNVIQTEQQDVFNIQEIKEKTIICNPPYGIRMGKNQDLSGFYKNFGDFLKQRCSGSNAFIYFGERQYIKKIGLKPSWKKILSNSGLDGRLAKYELY